MPADQFALLALGLAFIGGVAGVVAYAASRATGGDSPARSDDGTTGGLRELTTDPTDPSVAPPVGPTRASSLFITPASTRQVARVVAFLFLASVAVVTALSGAWPDNDAAIFTLLAAGTLLVVVSMDMVPPAVLGRWRRPAEGVGAIVFLGLLMGLTGGVASPFFVGFFLVVAGSSLSTEGRAPLIIALIAAATSAFVAAVVSVDAVLEAQGLAWVGFNAVALILLADIATAAARAQRHARDEALRASRFDALTGLYNRSFFFTTMQQEIRRSERMGRRFTMLMLDLDDLKPVNDTFGHQWGDRLLRGIADVLRQTIRFTDAAARYGGDEFVVLLPETDAGGGYVVGEKLRRDIAALTLHAADRDVRSSVSVGLVTYPDDGTTIEQLVAAADVAMYESKRRGKNRIVGYQTRMERVATAIDADSAKLVQLGPSGEARTGGDPPPWASTGRGSREPARRRTDMPSHVIEVDRPVEAGSSPPSSSSAGSSPAAPEHAAPSTAASDDDAPWSGPPTPRSVDGPPESGPQGPPTAGANPAAGPAGTADAPWLTRTDAAPPSSTPPTQRPGERPGTDAPPQRPAADGRSSTTARSMGTREASRSDEIRKPEERPWIALPVEPYDPGGRPRGRGGQTDD